MHRSAFLILLLVLATSLLATEGQLGKIPYEKFESAKACATCHVSIARQHEQAMMSQAYVHAWDEIEYFELALPHAAKDPKVAGIKDGCNGCHAPMAFLAGDTPPPPPSKGSRANEAVTCDVCHTMTTVEGESPFNFNHVVDPGKTKRGPRPGLVSPHHETVESKLHRSADLCGTCHNEKSPYDTWVKATHIEWKDSPQARSGIVCQDCHMPPSKDRSATMADELPDMRQHLFHGAHDPGKLSGAVEVRIHPAVREAEPGERVKLTAVVVNAKAGHKIPTGSAEERVLWLDVVAKDSKGKSYHLPVDRKNFPGEEYTIADPKALAYQDIGDIKGIADFPGLSRDGDVPAGDRIFRLPYLDPKGRMTIAQWNTASFATDYRLAPLSAVSETYTWSLPNDIASGAVEITARVYYSKLVSSVAQYLNVPKEESAPFEMNHHVTHLTVVD